MRRKRLVFGLDNNQKIRFIVNGFTMYCLVKDIENIASRDHRVAVWTAAERIGNENWVARRTGTRPISGYGSNLYGMDVQVDLVDDSTLIR